MKIIIAPILVLIFSFQIVNAQNNGGSAAAPATQAYGKIDIADLEMKACDFEKDANAMVLFDKGEIYYEGRQQKIFLNRHKRIKIFNDNGKKYADVRIEFVGAYKLQLVEGLEAETVNLVNGKQEITKLDKKSIYIENTDKYRSAYIFSFPNVKAGSVLEFKYTWSSLQGTLPWAFQSRIPTRYSVLTSELPPTIVVQIRGGASAIVDEPTKGVTITDAMLAGENALFTLNKRSMTNVKSLVDEPYMTSEKDNLHSISFRYSDPSNLGLAGNAHLWNMRCEDLIDDDDFGHQMNKKLTGEEDIIAKAKAIPVLDTRIAYVFNTVRDAMKWNGVNDWYANDGTAKAWEKKSGNSTEINLILNHLLTKAGITCDPILVSTRDNGKVFGAYPTLDQFNRAAVYISTPRHYILDAADKFNMYNEIPETLLNNFGLLTNMKFKQAAITQIQKEDPTRQIIIVSADVKADGKMTGTADITNNAYSRINNIKRYKTDGEQKYIDYLRDNDNTLKISALKMENMEVDTLPLIQHVDFKADLTGSDGAYIYFVPGMFVPLRNNPFLSQTRMSDIDFGYRDNFSMAGNYKIPDGYKADALPKNITMQMPDQSITFKRVIGEQDGTLVVRFVIDYKNTRYTKDDYAQLYDFYKKLHELINEQIVLKKG